MSVPLIEKLTGAPVPVATARLSAAEGGAPAMPGFYAWWLKDRRALPDVFGGDNGLLYVGIAPRDADSSETIRSRVVRKHLGNAIGSSTFRFTLAALLWEGKHWNPETRGTKVALPPQECIALTAWMAEHLDVSWVEAQGPWDYECRLIEALQPPLNGQHNGKHPFFGIRKEARDYLRLEAR
jgi:hypothetical protein